MTEPRSITSKPRILVIRGGAIGDFILTLPSIRLLRETFAHCHLEILGYKHIAELALQCGPVKGSTYADCVRSIEYGPLAGFFAPNAELDPDLCEYFASFQQVVSWLFDPDGIFESNLKRAGVKHYLSAYARVSDEAHASVQLARGLERLALYLDDPIARLVPFESHPLVPQSGPQPFDTAIHPGAGGTGKIWPLENWIAFAAVLVKQRERILLAGGEVDYAALDALAPIAAFTARDLPLPSLAALFTGCRRYFGHDTGISHLAAAVGIHCTLLFGPTDPAIWAPQGPNVTIVRAPDSDIRQITRDELESIAGVSQRD